MVAALTGALALAGVGADAVTFVSRIGRSRHGRTRQEEGGGSGGDSGTRLRCNFHDIPPKDVGNDFQMRTKSRRFPGSSHAGKSSVQMRMTVDLPHAIHSIFRHWITHPELTTDDPRFGYSRSKRKFLFFG
jgi:hypothetical protein